MTYDEDRWTTCPPGEINRLAARLRGRRRRRYATRAATAVAVLVAGLGLWSLQNRPHEYHLAGISCSEVQEHTMAFASGDLEPALAAQVESHAEQCPRCHELFEEMGLLSFLLPADLARWSRDWLVAAGNLHHPRLDTTTEHTDRCWRQSNGMPVS